MKNKNFYQFVIVFALIFSVLFAWGYLHKIKKNTDKDANLPVVTVAPLTETEISVEKNYIGYVTPINDVVIKPYLSGFVKEVKVAGGQNVKAGDELVVLRQEEYEAVLASAEADLAKSEAELDYAEKYYQRVEKSGKRAFSQNDIDEAKSKFLTAKANFMQAESAVKQAQVNFDYTYIKATIDGVVGNVSLSVGDYVSPQRELFTLVQTSPMRVVFSISDKDYLEENAKANMFADENIKLRLVDGSIYEFVGKFDYIDNKIDPSTNAVAVYASFENPHNLLMPNEYVTVLLEKKYKAILLEKDYVSLSPKGNFVYVVKDDVIKKHIVNILAEKEKFYVVENDFEPQMQLLTSQIVMQEENQKVRIAGENK